MVAGGYALEAVVVEKNPGPSPERILVAHEQLRTLSPQSVAKSVIQIYRKRGLASLPSG